MPNNRRRHPRIRARGVAAHLRTSGGRIACQVENVSIGGMFVRTDQLEEVGTELTVDLVKPGWKKQLTLEARVSSRIDVADGHLEQRMPGMGLAFVALDDRQHERLQLLLRELGAPDEDLQVTLADDEAEVELRALDLESAIEGTLREVDLAPPGPVDLQPAATPEAKEPPTPGDTDAARLMVQLRGLVMQLSDAQQQLAQRESEIERLKEELLILRGAIDSARNG